MMQTATETEWERVEEALYKPSAFSRRQFARSLAWLALIPAVVYLLTFPLVMIPRLGFDKLGISKFGPVLDYGFEARNVNADVVIFGDSSAFLGIDPRVVNAELGIRSLVIPNTVGSLPVLGAMPLQRYLAHNRPPRLIVFYFTPWNLDYNDPKRHNLLFEGEEILFRYGSFREIAAFALRKPLEFLSFPFKVYSTLGWNNFVYAMHHRDRERTADALLGHMDYSFSYPPMASPCKLPEEYLKSRQDASVRSLVQRYAKAGTQVVVYLAPVPQCSNSQAVLHESFPDLRASKPNLLPPSWFVGDGADAHIRPAYVKANSELFAGMLRAQAQRSPQGTRPEVLLDGGALISASSPHSAH